MPNGGTDVMLIGALPVGSGHTSRHLGATANPPFSVYATTNEYNSGGGMPAQGGPMQWVEAPFTQPMWLFNAEARIPFNQDLPQLLPRMSWKGGRPNGPASTGQPITSALAGLNTPALGAIGAGDASTADQTYCTTKAGAAYVTAMQVGYVALGATFAGIHGYRRNGNKLGYGIGWGVAGALLPVLTGIVAVAQGYGKRA